MDNKVLKDITDYAVKKLNNAYGYCGLAENDEMAMLDSDDKQGRDIKITIKYDPE